MASFSNTIWGRGIYVTIYNNIAESEHTLMKKTLLLILVLYSVHSIGQSKIDYSSISLEDTFDKAFHDSDYSICDSCLFYLERQDSIRFETIGVIGSYYLMLGKPTEAIRFCNLWKNLYRNAYTDGMFDDIYGESYYYLKEYQKAEECFEKYFILSDKLEFIESPDVLAKYAHTSFINHNFNNAAKIYGRWYNLVLLENDESVYSRKAENNKHHLYNYARALINVGAEEKALLILKDATQCNEPQSVHDYELLAHSPTFARELEIPNDLKKEFEKIIETYDIKEYLPDDLIENPMSFWDVLLEHSPSYAKLIKANTKNSLPKTLRRAIQEIDDAEIETDSSLSSCHPKKQGALEQNIQTKLFGGASHLKDLRIYPSMATNAFATPYGHIYLTEGLYYFLNGDENLLLSICAHEVTHFECKHTLISKWQEYSREKKAKILAGVTAGAYAGAMAASGVNMATYGGKLDDDYWDNTVMISAGLATSVLNDAFYKRYVYSRSNEIEADIIAYRFCESIGISGYSFIYALELINDCDYHYFSNSTDDHPTLVYRIMLLKYLYNKEHTVYS